MRLYRLTPEEIEIVNNLNYTRTDVLLIVCCYAEYTGVDPEALQELDFAPYLAALGSYDESKVVEFEPPTMF